MRLTPDVMMMLYALFPDFVDIQFAPPEALAMKQATFNPESLLNALREKREDMYADFYSKAIDEEHIELEEIAGGVWAGMSKKTHTLFVKVAEKGDYG